MQCFIKFKDDIHTLPHPDLFTNPFHYTPHPLCLLAVKQIQESLPPPAPHLKGKMYGTLVVKTADGQPGFLAACSGNEQQHETPIPFVPQVFDITHPNGFFRAGEAELNEINRAIAHAEKSSVLKKLRQELDVETKQAQTHLQEAKTAMARAKLKRQAIRQESADHPAHQQIIERLIKESQTEKSNFNKLKKEYKRRVQKKQELLTHHLEQIEVLKRQRKERSAQLQKQLFDSYLFLNAVGESKSASRIFESTAMKVPPAGTGDCCAPKLLQYAYRHQLTPLAMAEFWWGPSPKKEIRQHGHFYPACKSKCEPVLGHMLQGLAIAPAKTQHKEQPIQLIYEDAAIALIHKPAGLLSVPGKEESTSVYSQVKALYPHASGPLIVHRLDMATSGLMLIAKTKEAHQHLQKQFLDKTIQKKYVAWLDGHIQEETGRVDLPLRVDLDDRPRQLVCHEHGKQALTRWEVIERSGKRTKVRFYPITGRTHQLRVHAAHPLGLNTPIVGDELYGIKDKRLMLHAGQITFQHPTTSKKMTFQLAEDF